MTIAILGLGLIGGSLAYALRGFRACAIVGYDPCGETARAALAAGAIDHIAHTPQDAARDADLCVFCSAPDSIIANMRLCFPVAKEGALLSDVCGVKKDILALVAGEMPETLRYIGLHPMAGKEVGGFVNAEAGLFKNAGFLLVLPDDYDEGAAELMGELSLYVGAGRVVRNRADEHDGIIAYSSDLMHISAAALVRHYPPNLTMAHAAGAFRDCTRIADIDAALWTQLLLKNGGAILPRLHTYIEDLQAVASALETGDAGSLHDFLDNAARNKRAMRGL